MVNGRNKGASFERSIANMLFADLRLNAKRDIEQYRAVDHGDIITDDETWPYVIECKKYMAVSITRLAALNGGCKSKRQRRQQAKSQCLSTNTTDSQSQWSCSWNI